MIHIRYYVKNLHVDTKNCTICGAAGNILEQQQED